LTGISSAPSRRGLLSGLALTGTVCCTSQWPTKSIYFSSRRRDWQAWRCWSSCKQGLQFIEDTVEPSFSCAALSPCSSCA